VAEPGDVSNARGTTHGLLPPPLEPLLGDREQTGTHDSFYRFQRERLEFADRIEPVYPLRSEVPGELSGSIQSTLITSESHATPTGQINVRGEDRHRTGEVQSLTVRQG